MQSTVLLINGSLRDGSVNAAVLKTLQHVAPDLVITSAYEGMSQLPHFNPDHDHAPLDLSVARLRHEIAQADALMFCTPEYAGGLPGSFKNLLDWTVGGIEMDQKPVGYINASSLSAPTGGEDAYGSLRKVLGYVGARLVEPACLRIPLSRRDIDPFDIIADSAIRLKIASALAELVNAVVQDSVI